MRREAEEAAAKFEESLKEVAEITAQTHRDAAKAIRKFGTETKRRDLIAEGLRLQREAGRMEQRQRAQDKPPPRSVLRALSVMQKQGRRGRKARARINRILKSKIPEAFKK